MDAIPLATIQHRDPATQAGFTQVPNAILTARQLTHGARLLYALLKMYAWQADRAFPGQQRLAEELGVSTRQLRNYLSELEKTGLLTVEQRGLRQTNRYWIEPIPDHFLSDRNYSSDPDRNPVSDQDRNCSSYKEYSGEEDSVKEESAPTRRPVEVPVIAERDGISRKGRTVKDDPHAPALRAVPKGPVDPAVLATWQPTPADRVWWQEQCTQAGIPPTAIDAHIQLELWRRWPKTALLQAGQLSSQWQAWMLHAIELYRTRAAPARLDRALAPDRPYIRAVAQ